MRLSHFITFLVFFIAIIGYSQEYPIQKYTPHQGLAQMQVGCILKDSRGIVWAGSYGGLSRFNGETFTNYTVADGLLHNHITEIHEDKEGYIWVKCGYTNGYIRFDGEKLKPFPLPEGSSKMSSLVISDTNEKLFFREDSSYCITDAGIKPYIFKNQPKNLMGSLKAFNFFKLLNSYVFLSNDTLYLYKNGIWKQINSPIHLSELVLTFDDKVIFKTEILENKYSYISWDGKEFKVFLEVAQQTQIVRNTLNHDFVFSNNEELFFIPKNIKSINWVAKNPPITPDLIFLNQPESETLWLPTEKGLWRLTRRGFRQFSEQQVPYCWGVVEDKFKNIFFQNFKISLQKFDKSKLTTIPFSDYNKVINEVHKRLGKEEVKESNDWYYKPLKDKNDNLWFPNVYGVLKFDNKKWDLFSHKGDALAFCIAEDTKRNKIVACGYEHLYTIDINKPNSIEIIKDTSVIFKKLLLCTVVSPLAEYWFSGKYIGVYKPDTKTFQYYKNDSENAPIKTIIGLYFDWQHRLWAFGIAGKIYLYDAQKDQFEPILKDYFQNTISFIEQVDSENLCISDINGLHILHLKTFINQRKVDIKVFNQHNGYNGVEPGQLGSFRDSEGNIWITSGSVLTKMTPAELDFQNKPIKTLITKVGNQRVSFLKTDKVFEIPNNENATTFTVESIGDNKSFRSQYSFRIVGFLDNWSGWQEQNLIMVNNLPNGVHKIEIRSRTGSLASTQSDISTIHFRVAAPFYKSPNFYKYAAILGLIFIISMAYFWLRERTQTAKIDKQRRKIDEQEKKVRYLQVQTFQAQMNPHFTFNVLGTLQHLILNNETQRASENLLKLSSLIRNYLEATLLGDGYGGSLFRHEILLSKEIELLKMYIEFEQLQYIERFDFEILTDGKINPDNYRIPPLIIQPFVENAIKHGLLYKNLEEKGRLSLHFISLNEDTLICKIEDDGVGREKAAEIQSKSLKKYKSRGTELVRRRVEVLNEMGYEIEIQTHDRVKGGTVVTIQIGYK